MPLDEGLYGLGAQALAHLLELPQFIRHPRPLLALAVDLGQPSHHHSVENLTCCWKNNGTARDLVSRKCHSNPYFSRNRPQAHPWPDSPIGRRPSRLRRSATGCARSGRCLSSRSNSTVISASGASCRSDGATTTAVARCAPA